MIVVRSYRPPLVLVSTIEQWRHNILTTVKLQILLVSSVEQRRSSIVASDGSFRSSIVPGLHFRADNGVVA